MLVALMGVAEGVAKKGHAYFAYDSQFKQTGVERVAQVMEADVPDSALRIAVLQPVFKLPIDFPWKVKMRPLGFCFSTSRRKTRFVSGISRASPSGVFE